MAWERMRKRRRKIKVTRPTRYKRRKILKLNSPKTTTKEGRNDYMREYMRLRRAELSKLKVSSRADFGAVHTALFSGVRNPQVRKKGRRKQTLRIP